MVTCDPVMTRTKSNTDFPPVDAADSCGLLMLGGDLSPAAVLEAYRRGIFPWPIVENGIEVLSWWSPDPRAIIELDRFHVSRRLARRIRSDQFRVTVNQDFLGVVAGCAAPRHPGDGIWLTPTLARVYAALHKQGHAHSVEVWRDEQLVGGVYGMAIGGFFAGESMFHRATDASKIALAFLVRRLRERGFSLFDIQLATPHTRRLGASEIPRKQFLRRLRKATRERVSFIDHPSRVV